MYIDEYDLIIVGAGVSGLVSAYKFESKHTGIKLLVIEATDHLGGRRHALLGNSITFISEENYISHQLLKELKIKVIPCKNYANIIGEFTNDKIYKVNAESPLFGGIIDKKRMINFLGDWEALTELTPFNCAMDTKEHIELDNKSMDAYLKNHLKSIESQNCIKSILESFCGVNITNISVLFYLAYCNSTNGITNQYSSSKNGIHCALIDGGAMHVCDTIVEYLGDESILFDHKVISIHMKRYTIIVKTENEIYKCAHVIMAIPPKDLLKVQFTPPLPDTKLNVLKCMNYDYKQTFLARYDKKFWEENDLCGAFLSNTNDVSNVVQFCMDISSHTENCLYGIIKNSCNPTQLMVLEQLSKYFGDAALKPLVYTHLGYARVGVPQIGAMRNFHQIRRPFDRIFFAGSETATHWYGHFEGAVQSGFRASTELLFDFLPNSLKLEDMLILLEKKKHTHITKFRDNPINYDWKMIAFKTSIVGVIAYCIYKGLKRLTKD